MAKQQLENQAVPHLCADKPGRTTGGVRQATQLRVPVWEKKSSKPLAIKAGGGAVATKTPSLIGEFVAETHRVLECTQTHPPRNQHQKGPI